MNERASIVDGLQPKVFLMTAAHRGQRAGLILTWLTCASLVPERKRLVFVLSPRNRTTELVSHSALFALHLLSESQAALVPRFGLYSSRDIDKFSGLAYTSSADGLPLLADTCGWAEGRIESRLDGGDRWIFLAEVTREQMGAPAEPLYAGELDRHLDALTLRALDDKFERDVELDRALLAGSR